MQEKFCGYMSMSNI